MTAPLDALYRNLTNCQPASRRLAYVPRTSPNFASATQPAQPERLALSPQAAVIRKPSYRVRSLAELLAEGFAADDLLEKVDALVGEHLESDGLNNNYGDDAKWRTLIKALPSFVFFLIYGEDVVGHWSFFPVSSNIYDDGINGLNINASIDLGDLDEFDMPGDYIVYFVDLVIVQKHRTMAANSLVYRSFSTFIKRAARMGYYIRSMFAHTSTKESIRLCSKVGFEFVINHREHKMLELSGEIVATKIFVLYLYRNKNSRLFSLDRQLFDLYSSHYPELHAGKIVKSLSTNESISELAAREESTFLERKATLRTNLVDGSQDDRMRVSVLKTISGFLNTEGGTLIIGLADDGSVVGISPDSFKDEDAMQRHLIDLIKTRIGDLFLPFVHPRFVGYKTQRLLIVDCANGPKPAFLKDGQLQRFFVRSGNSTNELSGNSITDYVRAHFG